MNKDKIAEIFSVGISDWKYSLMKLLSEKYNEFN